MAGRTLKASVVIGGLIDQSFKTVLTDSKRGFTQLGDTIKSLNKKLESTNIAVNKAKENGGAVDLLTGRYKALEDTVRNAKKAVKELNRAEQFKNRMDRGNRQAQFMAGRATMGAFAGGALLHNVLKESSAFQTEEARLSVMGVPEKAKHEALQAGKSLKTFGTTIRENVEMFNDGLAVFGNMKEARLAAPLMAKMKFANGALYGTSAEESERQLKNMLRVIDARGGANNEQAFNTQASFIQKAVNASKGNVTATDFFKMMSHAGTAMRSMSNKGFFFDLLPMIQELGGDTIGTMLQQSYNSLIQGHVQKRTADNLFSDGLIADKSKVKFDKNGNAAQLNPGALKGSDVYEDSPIKWVKTVMLPTLVEHGKITRSLYEHALKGTMNDQEKNTINTLAAGMGNSSTGGFITSAVANLAPSARDSGNAERSADIDGSVNAAKGTAKGQEMGVQAQLTNARLNLGQTIMPTYISLLQKANTALEKFNGFVTTHPKLTRAMMIGTVAVTGALAVSVPLLFTAGAAMSLYGNITAITARRQALFANSQLRATEATLMGTEAETAASLKRGTSFRAMFKGIGSVASRFTGNISGLFTEAGVAVSALFSPVGLTVGALVAGGVLIWKYWEPIKAFFSGFADGLSESFAPIKPLFSTIGSYISPVIDWFGNLLAPVHSTKEGLHSASSAGHRFGEALGSIIGGGFDFFKKFTFFGEIFKAIGDIIPYVSHLITDNWSSIEPVFEKIGGFIQKIINLYEKLIGFEKSFVSSGGKFIGNFLAHPMSEGGSLLSHPQSTIGSFFGGLLGHDEPQNGQALSYPANILQPVKPKSDEEYLPKIPSIGSASSRRGDVHVTHHITINQQPGQSHEDLVRELSDKLYPAQSPSAGAPLHDGLIGSAY